MAGIDYTLLAIGAAWVAILALLLWDVVARALGLPRRQERSLFFQRLDHHGITLVEAEEASSLSELSERSRRCATCGERQACRRELLWGRLPGIAAPRCPSAAFFERVAGSA